MESVRSFHISCEESLDLYHTNDHSEDKYVFNFLLTIDAMLL